MQSSPRALAAVQSPGDSKVDISSRNAAIDHIRIVFTGPVIPPHTAIVYGGSGRWYWREEPNASNILLVAFNAANQSFSRGFSFLWLVILFRRPLTATAWGAGFWWKFYGGFATVVDSRSQTHSLAFED